MARWPFLAVTTLALAYAAWAALTRAWVCDDAFISFRYADNLVRGLGLVYNAGERVEGYSNFLWTLWAAAGLRHGADAEGWSIGWGVAFYMATLCLLAWNAWRMRGEWPGAAPWLPVAAVLGAAHVELNIFATGGLETSLYTFLVTLVYVLLAPRGGARRAAAAGLVLGLSAMTRPDGPLLAALAGVFVVAAGPQRFRSAAALTAGFLLLWLPFTAWRVRYYGDFFPNPYYAKSAALAWYPQGLAYTRLYFEKYWVLAVGAGLAALAWVLSSLRGHRSFGEMGGWSRRVALAGLLAGGYTAYVVRVGGDFMYGRLLVPVTPLMLVLLELGVSRLVAGRAAILALAAAAAAVALTPYPFQGEGWVMGIVNEWRFYPPWKTAEMRRQGLGLRPYFEGLPVRLAFLGGDARMVYYAQPAVAIECQTGLTDRFIARQVLSQRGRVGHEKQAPLDYLLERRAAHFIFNPAAPTDMRLDEAIPLETVDLGGIAGIVLTWDPALMDSLRRRGAKFEDFPARLDRLLAEVPASSDSQVRVAYAALDRFYFRHVSDPRREQPFLERLKSAGIPVTPPHP